MSKKSIVLEYQTPLEFIATYSQKGYEPERSTLEEKTGKTLLELIAMIQEDEKEYWNMQNKIDEFASGCGFSYCYECDVYHEYDNCPFCSLGLKID